MKKKLQQTKDFWMQKINEWKEGRSSGIRYTHPNTWLVFTQFEAFQDNQLPEITDSNIINIQVEDNGERLVNVKLQNYPRISMLPDPSIAYELGGEYNAGTQEASYMREGLYTSLTMLIKNLDKNAPYFGYEVGQFEVKIYEALRSFKNQKKAFNLIKNKLIEQGSATPVSAVSSDTMLNAPLCTGGALTLRIYDSKNKKFLDMGEFGVWTKNPTKQTFCEDATEEQKHNRLFLLKSAAESGLVNNPQMWWAFSKAQGDKIATYWRNRFCTERSSAVEYNYSASYGYPKAAETGIGNSR